MADDSMPPKPDCEFDFNLPHGVEDEDGDQNLGSSFNETAPTEPPTTDGDESTQHMIEYTFQEGFSDDEGGEEAFVRSWAGHQARKASRKQKKSPRRSENSEDVDMDTPKAKKASPRQKKSPRRSDNSDADNEDSPKPKKPRKSLFGGPVAHVEERPPEHIEDEVRQKSLYQEMADRVDEVEEATNSSMAPGPNIRQRMSSLNLDQQEEQDNRPFSLGFGLAPSERDSQSPEPLRAAFEDDVVIPKENPYELRQNINRSRPFTYLDSDKTGNYDPAQETRLKMLRLQRAKAAKKKGKGKAKAKPPEEHVLKCIVKLRFKAFGNVRNRTDDTDNWPPGWSDVDPDYEEATKDIREFYRHDTPDIEPQVAIVDPKGDVDDLTGQPAARGCKHCRQQDHDCNMVEGGTYPCEQCEDDGIDCVPCMTPKVKGGCRQCVDDGQDCSFEDGPGQTECDHCMDHGYNCESLPPRGYKMPRNSYDVIMYGPNRKHVQCTYCRMEKKRCSLKKKTDKPPCRCCKKNGLGCTFYDIPKLERGSKAAGKQKAKLGPTDGDAPKVSKPGSDFFSPEDLEDLEEQRRSSESVSRETTPEIEMEDGAGNKGSLTKIKTSFAHPIEFNAQIPECSFCEMPSFGFFGHYEREVHVIQWYSGLGYTEVGGGWAEEFGPTTMCEPCTLARLQIIACGDHNFISTDEQMPAEVLLDMLLDTKPNSEDMRFQLQRWCSVCFTPASWGCCKVQPSVAAEEGDEEGNLEGCGLRLCDRCFEKLRDEHIWDLEKMALELEGVPKTNEEEGPADKVEGKIRADVGFLRTGGLMMRNMFPDSDGMMDLDEH